MAIYYSSATITGVQPKTGFGVIEQPFSFAFPTAAVSGDQVALAWIPIGATVTAWAFDATAALGGASSQMSVGDFTGTPDGFGGAAAYMAQATVGTVSAMRRSGAVDGSRVINASKYSSLYVKYTAAATLTGYATPPPEVADVFRLICTTVNATAGQPTIYGSIQYVMD